MIELNRFVILPITSIALLTLFVTSAGAQSSPNDNRQEFVRSSSPTKSGGRVFNETAGGQRMVRIARGPGKPVAESNSRSGDEAAAKVASNIAATDNVRDRVGGYAYPEANDEVTAFRQAANFAPQLNFPQANRVAQCNCNTGLPIPPQQLQFPQQTAGYNYSGYQAPANFQAPTGFQPQAFGAGFGGGQANGYPIQSGIGVPQFNQTGGSWWTPFVTGSGYYTPLLNFRNMPPGTYLGQGIIGQPTAYVDGQPVRNLLRYVSP